MAEFSVKKRAFMHRKFAYDTVFPMFVLNRACKNRSSTSVVHRNKLEWLSTPRQFVSRFP
jgi:hypothetical protein